MMLHQNEGFESWDVYQWKGSIFQCGRSFFKIWLFTDIYNYIHEPKESQSFQSYITNFYFSELDKVSFVDGKNQRQFSRHPFFLLVQYMLTPLSLLSRLESQDNWPSMRDLQYKKCSKASQLFSHNCETCIKQKKAIEKPNVSCKKWFKTTVRQKVQITLFSQNRIYDPSFMYSIPILSLITCNKRGLFINIIFRADQSILSTCFLDIIWRLCREVMCWSFFGVKGDKKRSCI